MELLLRPFNDWEMEVDIYLLYLNQSKHILVVFKMEKGATKLGIKVISPRREGDNFQFGVSLKCWSSWTTINPLSSFAILRLNLNSWPGIIIAFLSALVMKHE